MVVGFVVVLFLCQTLVIGDVTASDDLSSDMTEVASYLPEEAEIESFELKELDPVKLADRMDRTGKLEVNLDGKPADIILTRQYIADSDLAGYPVLAWHGVVDGYDGSSAVITYAMGEVCIEVSFNYKEYDYYILPAQYWGKSEQLEKDYPNTYLSYSNAPEKLSSMEIAKEKKVQNEVVETITPTSEKNETGGKSAESIQTPFKLHRVVLLYDDSTVGSVVHHINVMNSELDDGDHGLDKMFLIIEETRDVEDNDDLNGDADCSGDPGTLMDNLFIEYQVPSYEYFDLLIYFTSSTTKYTFDNHLGCHGGIRYIWVKHSGSNNDINFVALHEFGHAYEGSHDDATSNTYCVRWFLIWCMEWNTKYSFMRSQLPDSDSDKWWKYSSANTNNINDDIDYEYGSKVPYRRHLMSGTSDGNYNVRLNAWYMDVHKDPTVNNDDYIWHLYFQYKNTHATNNIEFREIFVGIRDGDTDNIDYTLGYDRMGDCHPGCGVLILVPQGTFTISLLHDDNYNDDINAGLEWEGHAGKWVGQFGQNDPVDQWDFGVGNGDDGNFHFWPAYNMDNGQACNNGDYGPYEWEEITISAS